jgi:predicted CXXCH cytochrome family protein
MKDSAFIILVLIILLLCPFPLNGNVTGPCSNCHTMHNSQDGSQIFNEKPNIGGPGNNLLRMKCIACHSSTDGQPTKDLGSSIVPIVYSGSEPIKITAGGNFWYVQNFGDGYGHNVLSPDATLTHAPGGDEVGYGPIPNTCGFGGCHQSLARIRVSPGADWNLHPLEGNGCVGCHVPRHHAPDPEPKGVVGENEGYYRFLGSPGWAFNIPPHSASHGVSGIEDSDWEITVSESDHNEYLDTTKPAAPCAPGSANPKGISSFCAGCHLDYHSWDRYNGGAGRNRTDEGWLRHPAGDTELPAYGEYAAYTVYNPQAPVSRSVLISGTVSSVVTPGTDRVMCLSCHRAHGSPYPDMLRWDYNTMIAADSTKSGGCFICHTNKNKSP